MRVQTFIRVTAAAAILALPAPVKAQTFAFNNSAPFNAVPGLTSYRTDFGEVLGMTVSWTFASGGGSGTWATLGSGNCGVSSTNFLLRGTCNDDTYDHKWTLSGANITSFTLYAAPGLGVFDRIASPDLSPGSSAGQPFEIDCSGYDSSCDEFGDRDFWNIVVTYSNPVGINGAAPLYDLYSTVTVQFRNTFNTAGGGSSDCDDHSHSPDEYTGCDWLKFYQDMDNVSASGGAGTLQSSVNPEPATMTLMATGLIGMSAAARRRRKTA